MSYKITLIETGEAIARHLQRLLNIPDRGSIPVVTIYTTAKINEGVVRRIITEKDMIIEKIEVN